MSDVSPVHGRVVMWQIATVMGERETEMGVMNLEVRPPVVVALCFRLFSPPTSPRTQIGFVLSGWRVASTARPTRKNIRYPAPNKR